MLVGRLTKETTDIRRVIVDFTPWLDLGETITGLTASQIIYGNNGWSSTQPPWQLAETPYDPTPLAFALASPTVVNTNTAVQFFTQAGTPGAVYTVQVVVAGSSGRIATMEVMVQLSGIPPVDPGTSTTIGALLGADGATLTGADGDGLTP